MIFLIINVCVHESERNTSDPMLKIFNLANTSCKIMVSNVIDPPKSKVSAIHTLIRSQVVDSFMGEIPCIAA